MGRRVGQFMYEGKVSWIEPEKVKGLPSMRYKGHHFKLSSDESIQKIILTVIGTDKMFKIAIDEIMFGTLILDCLFTHMFIEDKPIFQEFMDRAIAGLNGEQVFDGFTESEWNGEDLILKYPNKKEE